MLKEPLTYHQIIHIAAEFAERGHVLDLESSSRIDRRLSFEPRLHDNLANPLIGGLSGLMHVNSRGARRDSYHLPGHDTVSEPIFVRGGTIQQRATDGCCPSYGVLPRIEATLPFLKPRD